MYDRGKFFKVFSNDELEYLLEVYEENGTELVMLHTTRCPKTPKKALRAVYVIHTIARNLFSNGIPTLYTYALKNSRLINRMCLFAGFKFVEEAKSTSGEDINIYKMEEQELEGRGI